MDGRINGNPTKLFFINMITRDISIRDAILDLLDNSIDGAGRIKASDFSELWVKMTINKKELIIEDNCGGFSLDIARKYAFRFGRPSEAKSTQGSIGRFGVGMKRALFKMGKNFEVESKTHEDHFQIDVDVEEWKNQREMVEKAGKKIEVDSWDFKYKEVDDEIKSLNQEGTYVRVSNLYPEVSYLFEEEQFLKSLKADIERLLNFSLEKGIKIFINGILLSKRDIIIFNDKTSPFLEIGKLQEGTTGEVSYRVIAGLGNTGEPAKAGWYIYCNNRLVLEADKSEVTGWKVGSIPQYTNDYAMFRGVVFLDSDDPINLPLTTTKKGVDSTSEIYRAVFRLMKESMHSVISFLRKVRKLENPKEYRQLLAEQESEKLNIQELKTTAIEDDHKRRFCPPPLDDQAIRQKPNTVRISFIANRKQAEQVKEHDGSKSFTQLGENLFNYYIKMEELDI